MKAMDAIKMSKLKKSSVKAYPTEGLGEPTKVPMEGIGEPTKVPMGGSLGLLKKSKVAGASSAPESMAQMIEKEDNFGKKPDISGGGIPKADEAYSPVKDYLKKKKVGY